MFGIKIFWTQPIKFYSSAEMLLWYQELRSKSHAKKLLELEQKFIKISETKCLKI